MINKSKRLISVIIILALMFSLCISAFAAQDKPVYLCLGDSIGSGAALTYDGSEYTPEKFDEACIGFAYETMPNAYHSLVKNALSERTEEEFELIQGARAAMRTVELRYLLGGGYNEYDGTHSWYDNWAWPESEEWYSTYDGENHRIGWMCLEDKKFNEENLDFCFGVGTDPYSNNIDYAESIKKAGIITLNFGSNDVFSTPLVTAVINKLGILYEEQPEDPVIAKLKKILDCEGINALIDELVELSGTVKIAADIVSSLLLDTEKALIKFKENYRWVVNKIHDMNPDAIIIGVGVFNPLNFGTISEDLDLDISAAMALKTQQTNDYIRSFALTRDYYYYADISDVQTHKWYLSDALTIAESYGDAFLTFMMNVHPTKAGHQYIAKQILNVIPKSVGGNSTSKFADILNTTLLFKGLNKFTQRVSDAFTKTFAKISPDCCLKVKDSIALSKF